MLVRYVVIPTPRDNLFLVLHIFNVIASADYLNDYPLFGLIYKIYYIVIHSKAVELAYGRHVDYPRGGWMYNIWFNRRLLFLQN